MRYPYYCTAPPLSKVEPASNRICNFDFTAKGNDVALFISKSSQSNYFEKFIALYMSISDSMLKNVDDDGDDDDNDDDDDDDDDELFFRYG